MLVGPFADRSYHFLVAPWRAKGETQLYLKRTILPTDESGAHLRENRVRDKVVEGEEADREQQKIREQRLNDRRHRQRLRRPDQCDSRGNQSDDKESQREVGQGKLNKSFHGEVKFSVKQLTLARPLRFGQVFRYAVSTQRL